jgi:hypothetical protein
MKAMKKFYMFLLTIVILLLEVYLFFIWLLAHMDYSGILTIYILCLIARCILYGLFLHAVDMMWVKYITHNTKEYRQGLIKLYNQQLIGEGAYMILVLNTAIVLLENGNNPTSVENWVVNMEKIFRK